jgi:TonB family protein
MSSMIGPQKFSFEDIDHVRPERRRFLLSFSITLHLCFLAWLLRAPSPTFLAPQSIVRGERNGSATALFFPTRRGEEGAESSSQSRAARSPLAARSRLTWTKSRNVGKSHERELAIGNTEDEKARLASSGVNGAVPLGSPYGSVSQGAISGFEIRPALWASGTDPFIAPTELGGVEGDVVVEITIDEHGNVVRTSVLRSLNAAIDAKVVAALGNWHFHPATRDGIAVASKQDVYYHFPQRR